MRLIDADALKESLTETLHRCDEWIENAKDGETRTIAESNYTAFLESILRVKDAPTIDAVPRWIPREERLPEEYGSYLITTNDGRVDLALFGDTKDEKAWSSCDANGFYWLPLRGIEVIAWMPLPEPYKGERSE